MYKEESLIRNTVGKDKSPISPRGDPHLTASLHFYKREESYVITLESTGRTPRHKGDEWFYNKYHRSPDGVNENSF